MFLFYFLLVCLTSIIRYKQLRYLIIKVKFNKCYLLQQEQQSIIDLHNRLLHYNRISLVIAFIASFLMSMVGNFRTSEANDLHCMAASSMLITMYIYGAYHVYISWKLSQNFHNNNNYNYNYADDDDGNGNNNINIISTETFPLTMAIVVLIGVASFTICIIASFTSFGLFGYEQFYNNYARLHWNSDQSGYVWHVICTITEWITINIYIVIYLCFYRRMRLFNEWDKVMLE